MNRNQSLSSDKKSNHKEVKKNGQHDIDAESIPKQKIRISIGALVAIMIAVFSATAFLANEYFDYRTYRSKYKTLEEYLSNNNGDLQALKERILRLEEKNIAYSEYQETPCLDIKHKIEKMRNRQRQLDCPE